MPYVTHVAVIDHARCTRCPVCIRVCPTNAIRLDRTGSKPMVLVDDQYCLDCTICMTRCPEHAIVMETRGEPLRFGVDWTRADPVEVARVCRAAHMHEEQIICFCRQTQAREVAAAILLGHRTPEDLARATGIRTGCGVLCVTSVLRLLKAAGVELQKAPGWQWYGTYVTIWDLPPEAQSKYPEYFLKEDLELMNTLYPRET
jgi:Pyruvate/2-oxoacid:ferredoxin oxidoreductase delta subunit/bacterioferritin-associated ferredoxin